MISRKLFVIGCIAAALVAAAIWYGYAPQSVTPEIRDTITPTATMNLDGIQLRIAVADTPALRQQGLSGVKELAQTEGMLFVFEEEGRYSFWMKDMHFPIDMLWLSSDGRVVFIESHAKPESYPRSFISSTPARYVLEVGAGFSEKYGIEVGDRAVF